MEKFGKFCKLTSEKKIVLRHYFLKYTTSTSWVFFWFRAFFPLFPLFKMMFSELRIRALNPSTDRILRGFSKQKRLFWEFLFLVEKFNCSMLWNSFVSGILFIMSFSFAHLSLWFAGIFIVKWGFKPKRNPFLKGKIGVFRVL